MLLRLWSIFYNVRLSRALHRLPAYLGTGPNDGMLHITRGFSGHWNIHYKRWNPNKCKVGGCNNADCVVVSSSAVKEHSAFGKDLFECVEEVLGSFKKI